MAIEKLPIASIRRDGGTQIRARRDDATVEEYAEALRAGQKLPPAVVYVDAVGAVWLADGFHRLDAAVLAGRKVYPCEVRRGSQRDAILHACGANAHHGLKRSNADKQAAVDKLLLDGEWVRWADNRIAEACAVSPSMVAARRTKLALDFQLGNPTERQTRDGRAISTEGRGRPAYSPRIDRSDAQAAPDDDLPTYERDAQAAPDDDVPEVQVDTGPDEPDEPRDDEPDDAAVTPAPERRTRNEATYAPAYDDRGRVVPAHLVDTFRLGREGLARMEGDLKGALERGQQVEVAYRRRLAMGRPMMTEAEHDEHAADMDEIRRLMWRVSGRAPGALCDACNAAGCEACGGLGFRNVAAGRAPRAVAEAS